MTRFREPQRDRSEWVYSYSQLEQFTSCGEKYRILKVNEDRPLQNPAAWLVHGNAYHNATEVWHTEGGNLKELYHTAWEEELARQLEVQPEMDKWELTPRVKKVETDLELRYAAGLVQIEAYEAEATNGEWSIADFYDMPAVEVSFELEFQTEVGKVAVRGKIDQIRQNRNTGVYEVVDLKTGSEQNHKYRQLGLYALAAREMFDIDVVWGRYFYSKLDRVPKSGDKAGRYSPYFDLRHYDRAYWTTEFGMMEQAVQNQIFLPNPGEQCGRCDAAPFCRARGLGF